MGGCCCRGSRREKDIATLLASTDVDEIDPASPNYNKVGIESQPLSASGTPSITSPPHETASVMTRSGSGDNSDLLIRALQQPDDLETMEAIAQHFDDLSWVKMIPPPPPPDQFPQFVTAPVEEFHKRFLVNVLQLMVDEGLFFTSKKGRLIPPFEFLSPTELRKRIEFVLPDEPIPRSMIVEMIKLIIRHQPHIGHPFFMEQRIAGLEPYSCICDIIGTCTNSSSETYILSTISTLVEQELINSICRLVGYAAEEGPGNGVMTPGSSLANGYAMRMAAQLKMPSIRKHGLSDFSRAVFYVSERSIYIHYKCGIFQGFGMDNVIPVDTLLNGTMNLDDLRTKIFESISHGLVPCMVIATAGTTVVRAIDPLDEIADICLELGLWFHVDATFGGAVLFSEKLRTKLKGIERSDSVTWSQHFVLGIPCTSSSIVVPPRHRYRFLQYAELGEGTASAFMQTPLYDSKFDLCHSHNTLLSSRRLDMFKFWAVWKAKGKKGLGKHINQIFQNVQTCMKEMKKREGFKPIMSNFEGTNVCFIYVPLIYRAINQGSDEFREKTSRLCLALKWILVEKKVLSLSYNELKPIRQTFLVLGLHNSAVTKKDIIYALQRIQYYGEALTNPKHELHARLLREQQTKSLTAL